MSFNFLTKIGNNLSLILLVSTFSVSFSTPVQAITEADCDRIYNIDTSNWSSVVSSTMYETNKRNCYEQAARDESNQNTNTNYSSPNLYQSNYAQQRMSDLSSAINQIEMQYYQETGSTIPLTEENVRQMMQLIGADSSEVNFVINQMSQY